MTEQATEQGTFSCRIDGRAGYLRLYDDRIDLVRSGRRGPRSSGPESIPLNTVTRVSTGKPGRLLTTVEVFASGSRTELKLPSIDADSVRDLLSSLVRQARPATAVGPARIAPSRMAPPRPPLSTASVLRPAAPLPAPAARAARLRAPDVSAQIVTAAAVAERPATPVVVTLPPTPPTRPATPSPPTRSAPPAPPVATRATVPPQSLPGDVAQRIERLAVLHVAGILSDHEFSVRRDELLSEV